MVIDNLQQALANAAADVRERHPELTTTDVDSAYARYRLHFAEGHDDPPVSEQPAMDELLLALWDVIVDRETAGTDAHHEDVEAFYAKAFAALLGERDDAPDETLVQPVALAPEVDVDTEAPAPVMPEAQQHSDMIAEEGPATEVPKQEVADEQDIYQIKVTLDGSKPLIWRRILVSRDVNLTNLHHVIQSSMGWSDSHMHQFYPQQSRPIARTGGASLSDLLVDEGEHCGYEYDFGDSWYHDLELEQKLPREERRHYPVCTGGQRACPPEDVGGIPGYLNMLAVLQDPSHPEYEDMASWLTQDFNPASFNIDQANLRLQRHGSAGFQAVN